LAIKQAIVLNDSILSEICGVNDQNLKIFEDLLGIDVFSRGNEVFLETEDSSIQKKFKSMIIQLEDCIKMGQNPNPDILKEIYESVFNGESKKINLLKNTYLTVPKVNARVFPRNYNQALYINSIEKHEMVFGIGPAGTGKTYLAVVHALKEIMSHSKRKLVLTRPIVEAGEKLGFLPGDLEQKVNPYLRPLYDAMESIITYQAIKELEENKIIEVVPLAYMRGRTLSDSIIILDEAQNTTKQQMKMFLTRIGEGSKTIITGDITQIDLNNKDNSGLLHIISILKNIEEICFTFFNEKDVVRNKLVKKIIQAYEAEEKNR
jgi:phosphate starvation-inducible protein PhoH and related proteins